MGSPITTHILDTSTGKPAQGVPITLEFRAASGSYDLVGRGTTNADGRVTDLIQAPKLNMGVYRIRFDTMSYFKQQDIKGCCL
jgi:5-hydroxyisourate hydrolase